MDNSSWSGRRKQINSGSARFIVVCNVCFDTMLGDSSHPFRPSLIDHAHQKWIKPAPMRYG